MKTYGIGSRSSTSMYGRDIAGDNNANSLSLGNAEHARYHSQVQRHMKGSALPRMLYFFLV